MNLVKKIFITVASMLAYPFMALPVFAVDAVVLNPCKDAAGIALVLCTLGGNGTAGTGGIGTTIQNVIIFLVVLAIVVALLYLLYGGVKWITSKGEKTEVEAARNHIIAAITGLIVVFLSIFILSLVLAAFGISFSSLTIPNISGVSTNPPLILK